ncbi:MAG: thioredoxin family protein [Sphingobacteriaceae bacterium]
MKKIIFVICIAFATSFAQAQTNFENALKNAKEKHHCILLNFSGSDWCIPCIKMHKDIFDNEYFKKMSDSLLVMVNVDFPRNKKNQLDANIRKQNEVLADKYNSGGAFPYTLLLDENGKVIKTWTGLPNEDVIAFTNTIRTICNNHK